jgi:hypothetical protein
VKSQINMLAVIQHLGMVNSLKSYSFFKEGNMMKGIQQMMQDEKQGIFPHPAFMF